MKIWVRKARGGPKWFRFYYKEPEWDWFFKAWVQDTRYGKEGYGMCPEAFAEMGFPREPHGNELHEYSLAGKTPRLICVWIPKKEEE